MSMHFAAGEVPALSLIPVRQRLESTAAVDVRQAVLSGLADLGPTRIRPGMRIGVAVGSRGISRYTDIVAAVVQGLREAGAEPFLFPAMGSHGGGTAEGQQQVLVERGMGELGVPIRSTQDTVEIGTAPDGMPVHWNRLAAAADGVVVVNRIKAHTAFRGRWESGLFKMIAVGIGNRRGAEEAHGHGIDAAIPAAARVAVSAHRVLAGVAVVEDGRHEPALIRVLPGEAIEDEEPRLLDLARRLQPGIPFPVLDLLIVQQMGKDISGTGMDTNVIGMWRRNGGPREPDYRCIAVLELTPGSHGNATGIGMADLVPRRLAEQVDWPATYLNCLAARNFAGAKQPIVLPTDRDVIGTGLTTAMAPPRVALIRNTLEVDIMWVSPSLTPAAVQHGCEVVGEAQELQFDSDDRLIFPSVASAERSE